MPKVHKTNGLSPSKQNNALINPEKSHSDIGLTYHIKDPIPFWMEKVLEEIEIHCLLFYKQFTKTEDIYWVVFGFIQSIFDGIFIDNFLITIDNSLTLNHTTLSA